MRIVWVTAFLDLPAADHDAGSTYWQEVTGYASSTPRGDDGEFTTLLPADGDPFLKLQRRGEGPSRLHLDLHVDDPERAADEAVGLGARVVLARDGYVVLTSPGGLTFCLVDHPASVRPAPVTWPEGDRSLVDQVCLDIPSSVHEREVGFWAALTGWERWRSPVSDAFGSLVRPAGIPVRLLLQRLDEPEGVVRAHLDLAVTDRAVATARHQGLGGTVVAEHPLWTVLTDPTGTAYCLTDRDPETGMLLVPLDR